MPVFEISAAPFLFAKLRVPANTSGVIPVAQPIRARLPYHIRAAFGRGRWRRDKLCSDILRRDLVSLKGKPLGTVFAKIVEA